MPELLFKELSDRKRHPSYYGFVNRDKNKPGVGIKFVVPLGEITAAFMPMIIGPVHTELQHIEMLEDLDVLRIIRSFYPEYRPNRLTAMGGFIDFEYKIPVFRYWDGATTVAPANQQVFNVAWNLSQEEGLYLLDLPELPMTPIPFR